MPRTGAERDRMLLPEKTHRYRQVLQQTVRDAWAANAMEWSAALAFHVVLSLFPLVLAGAAIASLVVDPVVVADRLGRLVEGVIPAGVVDVDAILSEAIAERRQVGIFAVLLWLVSGRRVLGMLVTALDRVSDVDQRQETISRRAWVELVLLAGIGLLFLAALAARWILGMVWELVWGAGPSDGLAWGIGAGAHALLLVIAFAALYAVVPRGDRRWQAVLAGAVAAAALYLAARTLFLALGDVLWGSFAVIYGPLAVAAVFLAWAWVVGMIVLFGASLASHVKVMILEGHGSQEAERKHVAHKAG
jgi:YihY family inner membrane protein